VNQQITHCDIGITQIGAEKCFAEIFDKLITRRMATEKLAPLMTRTIKGAVTLIDIVDKRTEERRT
jgi:hypothetical protein